MTDLQILLSIAVITIVTAATRFAPFVLWGGNKKTPEIIAKLGKTLPFAVMGMLVVFCLKEISFTSLSGFLPTLISAVVTAVLYVWKRNTLISIVAGTLCNMLLVQLVF